VSLETPWRESVGNRRWLYNSPFAGEEEALFLKISICFEGVRKALILFFICPGGKSISGSLMCAADL
jgi:hypothetical protein